MSDTSGPPGAVSQGSLEWRRVARPIALAMLVFLAYAAWLLVPSWLALLWALIPRWFQRGIVVAFLNGLLAAYVLALVSAVGLLVAGVILARRPGPLLRRPRLARLLLLASSVLLGVLGLEAATAAWMGWLHRAPAPPPRAADPADNLPTRFEAAGSPGGPLRLLVIGESSGRGEPYHPWLSVGQIVGWQLERTVLRRPVQVDVWATGGATLESMHQKLADLTYRPDALIVFSGHNEFQARYAWSRNPPYYPDQQPGKVEASLLELVLRRSPVCRLVLETLDRQRVDAIPPERVTRELVDRPTCSPRERADILADFRRRVEAIAAYGESLGTLPVFIVPASNDGDYEPSRSVLPESATPDVRRAFAEDFQRVRDFEKAEPSRAIAEYRRLLGTVPDFAETHFRLARLLEQSGSFEEARDHYVLAREADAMPLRCPEDFRRVYREAAARHPGLVLVDSARVFESISPHGILDDHVFHDAQHPNLVGYIALAQDLLRQLHDRRALGWPDGVPVPTIEPDDCARQFGLDREKWAKVCGRSAFFYHRTAYIRYDPAERLEKERLYIQACDLIAEGKRPEEVGVVGLGTHPAALP